MKTNTLIVISILLTSCTKIVEKALGIKTKDVEITLSEAKIYHERLANKGLVSDSFYYLATSIESLLDIPFKPNFSETPAFQFKCFNGEGILVMKYGICEGFHKHHDTWGEFPPQSLNQLYPTNETLFKELSFFQSENSKRISVQNDYDYFFTI
jgi:hypothetical protein